MCLRPTSGTCKERADRGWPKARWALRHSGQMSSSAWKAIQSDLKSVRVEGVRCPRCAVGSPAPAIMVGGSGGRLADTLVVASRRQW